MTTDTQPAQGADTLDLSCRHCGGFVDDNTCDECGGEGAYDHYPLDTYGSGSERLCCDNCNGDGSTYRCHGACNDFIAPEDVVRP